VPKRLKVLFLLLSIPVLTLSSISSLKATEKQVRVIVERAPIYAENNVYSYKIEILRRGTILTVFETGEPMEEWFYVRYQSKRWKSVVTGFIQASMIEEVTDESQEEPAEEPKEEQIEPKPKTEIPEPKPNEEKPRQKPAEAPKKAAEEKPTREEPPKITIEEVLVASSLLPQKLFTLPRIEESEMEPRIFMFLETRPPQKKIAVPQREQITKDVQPKIEKPEPKPAKIEPEEAPFVEIESVGITPMPPSISYALAKVEAELDSPVFQSVEQRPISTQSGQTQTKSVTEITKKTPEKIEERQPPQKPIALPEAREKEEAAKKEKETTERETEQQQIKPPLKKPEEPKAKKPQIATEEPPRPKRPKLPSELSLFTFSVGYGPSLGSGLGGFVQLNTKMGFSLHLGAGYYPTTYYYSDYDWVKNKVLYSAGLKYYLPFKTNIFRTYLDLQYGGVSVEAVRLVTAIWYYQYIYENIQKTLYGPSLLAGIELKLGSIGLNGAIGLSYNTTKWDYWERDYFLTADLGLLLYLW
jgi:hypothetical protein